MDFALIVIQTLSLILNILQWIILVWVILSWVLFFLRESKFRWRHRQFYGLLEQLDDIAERMTRPFLRPLRRMLRKVDTAGIDWSPMILLILIFVIQRTLAVLAYRLYSPK
jgi:uncharacterized protein YggT (Ycf19 family)